MTTPFTADFMSEPKFIIVTCTTCGEREKIPTYGIVPSGVDKGKEVLVGQPFIDKQIIKFRKAHEMAHKEDTHA